MATSDEKNFVLMRYTDDDGDHWTMRVEQTYGENGDYGFAAVNPADPVWIESGRNRARTVTLKNVVTGRTRTRRVGNRTCDAWTDPSFTDTVQVAGLTAAETFQKIRKFQERKAHYNPVVNAAEFVVA